MMPNKDIYIKLAEMIDEEDIVGNPVTPSFLKLLELLYTPDEAALSLEIHLSGGTLAELSNKIGIEKEKLEARLLAMADKGTIIYDPAEKDPVYKSVGMTAGGLTESGLWGNIRFPFTVALGKLMHQVSKEHAEEGLAKLGFPFTPVWATRAALPDDVIPEEDLAETIKNAEHWSVSMCPCRLSRNLVNSDNPCENMLETCIHTGALSRWSVKHGMARELTYQEVLDLLKRCNENGLVHTINLLGQICNCCKDCCAIFHTYKMGVPTFAPSPFMAIIDEESCTSCETCSDRCPVDAITIDNFAKVDHEVCIGCGVCYPTCPAQSVSLERRETT